jgi:hypothetical protein
MVRSQVSFDCPLCQAKESIHRSEGALVCANCGASAPDKPLFEVLITEPRYSVLIMVGSHRGSSWAIRDNTTPAELATILADWAAGPEEALRAWFGREPPGPADARVEVVDEADAVAAAKASGATPDGLGL